MITKLGSLQKPVKILREFLYMKETEKDVLHTCIHKPSRAQEHWLLASSTRY